MKKLVFTTMAMQNVVNGKDPVYKTTEKSKISLDHKMFFPISVKFTESLEKDDDVTICVLKMTDGVSPNGLNHYNENIKKFMEETTEIANRMEAKIQYKEIESDFSETKDAFGKRFMEMFDMLTEGCTVYADITFGSKPSAFLILNILYFAEKFYNADIDSVVYGRVLYKDEGEKTVLDPESAKVCDVTILYLLNNLTSVMNVPDGNAAKEALKIFFDV